MKAKSESGGKKVNIHALQSELMAIIEKIRDSDTDGWLTPGEGTFLYMAAQSCTGNGDIVEIGSWKGLSTTFIAKGSKAGKNVKVYAIDPHTGSPEHKEKYPNIDTYEEFKTNLHDLDVDDIVIPIKATSAEVAADWNKPIELIFIDGAHEYKQVKQDFDVWYPYLIEGGMIALHDTTGWEGPAKVAKEEIVESGKFYDIRISGSITFGRRI
jgi:predicted O-methyltransferase YrrM